MGCPPGARVNTCERGHRILVVLDEDEVKNYLQLHHMRDAMFWAANQLYGLVFTPKSGIPVYHRDVTVYEVTRDGEHLVELALKTLQQRLDPQCFLQVHRAAIVNLRFVEHIEREPSGRCVVELKHGLGRVEASRSGAELLRSL